MAGERGGAAARRPGRALRGPAVRWGAGWLDRAEGPFVHMSSSTCFFYARSGGGAYLRTLLQSSIGQQRDLFEDVVVLHAERRAGGVGHDHALRDVAVVRMVGLLLAIARRFVLKEHVRCIGHVRCTIARQMHRSTSDAQ